MKLIKLKTIVHAIRPSQNIYIRDKSFCGHAGSWNYIESYEGSGHTVTCKICKKLMQKYIIKKLKQED